MTKKKVIGYAVVEKATGEICKNGMGVFLIGEYEGVAEALVDRQSEPHKYKVVQYEIKVRD